MADKNYSIMAEQICRREYEKHFDIDFSKPDKEIYYNSKEELFNFYKDIADFWNELGQKHDKYFNPPLGDLEISMEKMNENIKQMHPLNTEISSLCLWMRDMTRIKMLEVYRDKNLKYNL